MPESPSVEETLGTMSLCFDSTPKHDTLKIDYDGVTADDVMRSAPSGDAFPQEMQALELPMAAGGAPGGAPDAESAPEQEQEPNVDEAGAMAWRELSARRPGGPVKAGTLEAFYLLATYCFDLQRKMEYLYKATRAFGPLGDPAVARQLLEDERRVNAPGITWKQRALRAEARMLELQREIGREHLELLRSVASGSRDDRYDEKGDARDESAR